MHFRVRRNVVQLVRTTYDSVAKKPKAEVVGRVPIDRPEIGDELRSRLTAAELAEFQTWSEVQHRIGMLREEHAALTLSETLSLANRWFARQGDTPAAAAALVAVLPELNALRRSLKLKGLLG